MKLFYIRRLPQLPGGVPGILYEGEMPFALTLERKWANNKPGESCIPIGEYTPERVQSPKFGNTFEVKPVLGRTTILLHKGNIDDDSHGCILVGEMFTVAPNGDIAIGASGDGFKEFLDRLKGETSFRLVISEVAWK